MRISDGSSDVCSSDLQHPSDRLVALGDGRGQLGGLPGERLQRPTLSLQDGDDVLGELVDVGRAQGLEERLEGVEHRGQVERAAGLCHRDRVALGEVRSEEHTSELQSLMRISYAVFGLKKKKN